MRTRIKICGLTREEDIAAAVEAGADALGFVFYPKSKRCLTVERAAQLRREIPAFVSLVALFVNATADEIRAVQDAVQPDLLQFHGDETPERCREHQHRYVKAFRVGGPGLTTASEVLQSCLRYKDAAGWLFDSYT
ncbi:MAG: phosphoribosylanthranilate isomerase, partial [Alcaligenaceae bacterium]